MKISTLGIFDSGIGGLSVVRALQKRAPSLDFIYFGDTVNAPYGNRDFASLEHLTLEGFRFLKRNGATQLLSACNSISTSVVRPLFDLFDIRDAGVYEMVGPTVEYLRQGDFGKLGLVATQATVGSHIYQEGFADAGLSYYAYAIPELVDYIERGSADDEIMPCIRRAVNSVVKQRCNTLILGCTHYPFVRHLFEKALQGLGAAHVNIVDPAEPVASFVSSKLCHARTLNNDSRRLRLQSCQSNVSVSQNKNTAHSNVSTQKVDMLSSHFYISKDSSEFRRIVDDVMLSSYAITVLKGV